MSETPLPPGPPPVSRPPWHRNPWVWGFFIGMVFVTAIRPLMRHVPDPPPVLARLPEFSLIDSRNRPFGSADLQGRVYVANFFFTRCPSVCPLMMRDMAALRDRYEQAGLPVALVSFTVDPEHDTPQRLAEYGARLAIDPRRWRLLTGSSEALRALIEKGFLVSMGERIDGEEGLFNIAHAEKFALVDPEGRLRGLFNHDAQGLDEVFHRSQHVLAEKPPPR